MKVDKGEVISIIGPSGTGKSTLLRCINCLEKMTEGKITIGDVTVDAKEKNHKVVYELRKKTAMVFQNYNLFKNMTALQNVNGTWYRFRKYQKKKHRVRQKNYWR